MLLLLSTAYAQNTSCPCCAEAYRGFDFWLGDWTVHDTTGKQVGTNLIQYMHDSCVIQENYANAKGYTGTSYNFYNAADSSWNQTWVDNQGGSLILKGRVKEGKMVMHSNMLPSPKGGKYFHEIIWYSTEKGTVMQVWKVFKEDGNLIQLAFKGEYRRKE